MSLKMNDEQHNKRKLAFMTKSKNLKTQEFEEYLHKRHEKMGYEFNLDYDVIASELPYFKTIQYTEYAGGITMHPLQMEFRNQQMLDAYYSSDTEIKIDYVKYFRDKVSSNVSNKYENVKSHNTESRHALVVLPGSNKIHDRVSYEKLKYIKRLFGDNVWVKPHPLTTFTLVGEIMDLFGEKNVLHRQADLYTVLKDTPIVYTSMLSESALYGVCLDKKIEPIDIYQKTPVGSFYHINKFLFYEENPQAWVNKVFNDYRSGLIYPEIDPNWKEKVDNYLEYISEKRDRFKDIYFSPPKQKR